MRRAPELIPVLVSQPAGDVSHDPGGRLPLLSAGPAVTLATLKRAATNLKKNCFVTKLFVIKFFKGKSKGNGV